MKGHKHMPTGPRDRLSMAEKERLREEMLAKIYSLAHGSESDTTQLAAAQALLDRVDGKALQRNVHLEVTDPRKLSDAELDRLIAIEMAKLESSGGNETMN